MSYGDIKRESLLAIPIVSWRRLTYTASQAEVSKVSDFTNADFELAWKRLKNDRPDRVFVEHPFVMDVIESDLSGWFDTIHGQLEQGYAPRDCAVCYAPKPNWLVRPGAVLGLEDELLYNAAIGHCHSQLWDHLNWSQGDPDVGYRLLAPSQQPLWLRNDFRVWNDWRLKSLKALDDGVFYVLTTDITGFYENIDLGRLASDLKSIKQPAGPHKLLMSLLNRWSQPRNKGIPQGYSGSDILAKLYMDAVDRGMKNAGFRHLRYVDDIRVFCKSTLEAKKALFKLNDLVRKQGLNLQSAKTRILSATEARVEIDGVSPLIQGIGQQIARELKDAGGEASGSGSLKEFESFIESNPHAPPPEILERAFADNFSRSDGKFDKTLLHYLLTRLGKMRSPYAVDYCLTLLSSHPDETKHILRYLAQVPMTELIHERLVEYLESTEAIFEYQLYEVMKWYRDLRHVSPRLLTLCRAWMIDRNRAPWLRAYCISILGSAGDSSDLDLIEGMYHPGGYDDHAIDGPGKAGCVE